MARAKSNGPMNPGFWRQLYRPGPLSGATLEGARAWVVSPPPRPIWLASAFRMLLSDHGVAALEGVSTHLEVKRTLQPRVVTPALEMRPGTLYPTPEWLHVRDTTDALRILNELVNTVAGPEVCDHLYGYEGGTLLFEWHDAFGDPIQLAGVLGYIVGAGRLSWLLVTVCSFFPDQRRFDGRCPKVAAASSLRDERAQRRLMVDHTRRAHSESD